ncbi:hypothetical protein L9F63_015576, partial [Diploptera punctata]
MQINKIYYVLVVCVVYCQAIESSSENYNDETLFDGTNSMPSDATQRPNGQDSEYATLGPEDPADSDGPWRLEGQVALGGPVNLLDIHYLAYLLKSLDPYVIWGIGGPGGPWEQEGPGNPWGSGDPEAEAGTTECSGGPETGSESPEGSSVTETGAESTE